MPMTDFARQSRPLRRPRGFTFIEVMFAVLVMGVGVIMIAAMLPVALKKTQQTRETAAAAAVMESYWHDIEVATINDASLPVTVAVAGGPAEVYTWPSIDNPPYATTPVPLPQLVIPAFEQTFGNRVSSSDPTFAAIPFLRREPGKAPEVAIVAVRARNLEQFPAGPSDPNYATFFDPNVGGALSAFNLPIPVLVETRGGSSYDNGTIDTVEPDRILLAERDNSTNQQIRNACVQGAVVVVTDGLDRLRIFRIAGPARPDDENWENGPFNDPSVWNLDPEGGLELTQLYDPGTPGDTSDDFNVDEFGNAGTNLFPGNLSSRNTVGARNGYLIGRALRDPSAATNGTWVPNNAAVGNPYAGPTQVVGAFEGRAVNVP